MGRGPISKTVTEASAYVSAEVEWRAAATVWTTACFAYPATPQDPRQRGNSLCVYRTPSSRNPLVGKILNFRASAQVGKPVISGFIRQLSLPLTCQYAVLYYMLYKESARI